MDACNRPIRTISYGQFPTAILDADPELLYILLNILEKLGSLLFQTLPAATLKRYLPHDIEIVHANVHLNVVSPLFQDRSSTTDRKHIEESLAYLKDSDDPLIEEYYLKYAKGNPLTTAILERVLEIKGNTPKNYEDLPETLQSYLFRRNYKDISSTQTLTASGLTLVQAILGVMQANGRKTQALENYPQLIKDPETCRLRLQLAHQAGGIDKDTWRRHFEKTINKRRLAAVTDGKHGPLFEWSDERFDAYRRDSPYSRFSRPADVSQGDRPKIDIQCTRCHLYKCFYVCPEYTVQDHSYFMKEHYCKICWKKFASFEPVDQKVNWIRRVRFYERHR
ncbi:MAG: hypothetical protein Q9181_001716 [Wetmoreana brouardii]